MSYQEIKGDLITLAKQGNFDVIAHGCNCFCTMKSGIAVQMAKEFGCDKYGLETTIHKGSINKLGCIDYMNCLLKHDKVYAKNIPTMYNENGLTVVNAYTQYNYGSDKGNVDYDALRLCMRKINHVFKGNHIGLPQIGCGLAGGDWEIVKKIIQDEFADCNVTVVIY